MGDHPSLGKFADVPEDFYADPDDLEVFHPNLVLGYFHRLEELLNECPVDFYAASSLKHPWPYRLQKAGDCAQASFWRSQHRILDSNIMDPSLSNEDVLKESLQKKATAVVAKDYLPFKHYDRREYNLPKITGASNHWEATVSSTEDFISKHDQSEHPPAYFPLQPPYDEHIEDIRPLVKDSYHEERYMLGGLKAANPSVRIHEAEALRDKIGTEPHLHGLGWGPSDTLVRHLRENDDLIDSLDNSGPSQAIMNGQILDNTWGLRSFGLVRGDYRNSVAGIFEFGMLLQATHRLTKYNTEFDGESEQRNLDDYQREDV